MRTATCLLLIGLVGGAARLPSALASDDVHVLLNALRRERDPAERVALVERMRTHGGDRCAQALIERVHRDESARVRVAAARALGTIDADRALPGLVTLCGLGGTQAVRRAVARSLARRDGALAAVGKELEGERHGPQERALYVRALGWFRDPDSRDLLRAQVESGAAHLRGEALRALIQRSTSAAKRRIMIRAMLGRGRSVDDLMPALDAATDVLDGSLRDILLRTSERPESAVRAAAAYLLDELDRREAAARAAAKRRLAEAGKGKKAPKKDRYAKGRGAPPGEPEDVDDPPYVPPSVPRGVSDLMFVVDATASTVTTLAATRHRILLQVQMLADAGVNLRVGLLIYRGGNARALAHPRFDVLPLTYDLARFEVYLTNLVSRGVDDRGARTAEALHQALGRSAWRAAAHRVVHLHADGPCLDVDLAAREIRMHFEADRTRTRITYRRRTRTSVPSEYARLAVLGGTRAPEILR